MTPASIYFVGEMNSHLPFIRDATSPRFETVVLVRGESRSELITLVGGHEEAISRLQA